MSILKPLSGLLLLFIGIQAQSQADLNDFLRGQVVGSEIFMEYDYQAMLDSIDVLNAGTSSSSTPASTLWGVYTLRGADIDGEAADDLSGQSVSLSSDGTTVAIGANQNDGNGSTSGHVRIYAWNSATSAWEQQGADIDGEAADDYSGYSVSLSSDGTTVAIGATVTTATALTPVTFVFTHGIALQVLGNSKALTSTAKRRTIIAAIAFPFPPTARRLLLGRRVTTATALTPVTFVFTHGIALQVLGNSKALTSTAKRRMIRAARAFLFPPTAQQLPLGRIRTTATALPPVTFVFTHGIALQVLGNSKALTSTAKRRVIIAARAFPFPPTAQQLPLGRLRTTATALTPVRFVFTHGIALQVLGISKALTSTAERWRILAALAFSFPPMARQLPLARHITTASAA